MILVVDAINKHKFKDVLEEMFRLRARVFAERLGWDVNVENGMEIDQFDDLDPAYAIGLDDDGHVVSCARALQTTGPHMLADVFAEILDGEPPLRSPHVWESTRFCVDTKRLTTGTGRNSIAHATSELQIACIESAIRAGVSDVVTVVDPVMNRVLKRSGNAPYDYLGKTVPMGKVSAMAALLDATPERVASIRETSGISHDVFASEAEARALFDKAHPANTDQAPVEIEPERTAAGIEALVSYCRDQLQAAQTPAERKAALQLIDALAATLPEKQRAKVQGALRQAAA